MVALNTLTSVFSGHYNTSTAICVGSTVTCSGSTLSIIVSVAPWSSIYPIKLPEDSPLFAICTFSNWYCLPHVHSHLRLQLFSSSFSPHSPPLTPAPSVLPRCFTFHVVFVAYVSTLLYHICMSVQGKLTTPKTKNLVEALERWGVDQEDYGLLILSEQSPMIELSARNVEKLKLNTVDHLNVYDVLRADKIVVEESAFKYIQEFYGAAASEDASEDATPEEA